MAVQDRVPIDWPMKYSRTIDARGRVTVPREIRRQLGVSAKDTIEFVIEGNEVALRAAASHGDVLAKYRGILGRFPGGGKGIKAWLRDLRDE